MVQIPEGESFHSTNIGGIIIIIIIIIIISSSTTTTTIINFSIFRIKT